MGGMNDGESTALELQLRALAQAAHPLLRAGCRIIRPGDEAALTAAEAGTMRGAVPAVLRASGAARMVARTLLAASGSPGAELPRTAGGAPRWPAGFIGALAHDDDVAVAVVAPQGGIAGVGIDVEPALALPADLIDRVATPAERAWLRGDAVAARLVFCIKEAVYKACHPLDGRYLDFHDAEVAADLSQATTSSGRVLRVRASRGARLVALALALRAGTGQIPAPPTSPP